MSEPWDIERFPLSSEGAFDPAKPVDENWYEKGPGPLLRSGDEATFLGYDDDPSVDLGGEGQHTTDEHQGKDEYIEVPPSIYEAAAKKPKPKKPRTPEERRYDVLKHPDATPGGTGKSPEHHLRNRGWMPQVINLGAGGKVMQYMHPDFPGFAIQFGGATGTKPDHDFRVLDLANKHTPLAQRYPGPAEAMNRVEELARLQPGHMIVPMLHDSAWDIERFPLEHVGATGYPTPGKMDWAPDVQATWGGENDITYPYGHADAATERPKPPPATSVDVAESDISDWGEQYGGPPEPKTQPAQPKTTPAVQQSWPKKKGAGNPTEWKRQQRARDWQEVHPKVHGTPDGATFGRGDNACSDCLMAGTIEQHYPDLAEHVQWPVKDGVATLKSGMQLTADDLRTWFGSASRKPTWSHSDVEPEEGWDTQAGRRRRLASEAWWVVSS